MLWEELSSHHIAKVSRDSVCVLPTGAVEQHGPHLPLGTDALIAEAVAARLDEACGGRLLVLPAQRIGCSEHHMGFAGTLTFSHETFAAAAMETIGSVIRHGFRRILVLNAHGGNNAIGGVIAEKASSRWPDAEVVWTAWFRAAAEGVRDLVEGEYPSAGHACEVETSVMLALYPELVDMTLAQDDGIPPAAPQLRGGMFEATAATRSLPFDRLSRRGVFGKPTLATTEKGKRILALTVKSLRELVESCWPSAFAAPVRAAAEGRPFAPSHEGAGFSPLRPYGSFGGPDEAPAAKRPGEGGHPRPETREIHS